MNELNHQDGLEKIYKLRTKYEYELELVCLNSDYQEKIIVQKLLNKALKLFQNYPDQVIVKESEAHEKEYPYYEISIFCNQDELDFFKNEIINYGLELDIEHQSKDLWSPYK